MTETMTELKQRARKWRGRRGKLARQLIQDAHLDLIFCQPRHRPAVVEDLRQALLAIEQEMRLLTRLTDPFRALALLVWAAVCVAVTVARVAIWRRR